MATKSNLNPANAMTAVRFLTLPPFVYAISHGYQQWAMVCVFISAGIDLFDGIVARWLDCVTPFGAVFDAIADALCNGFMFIVLVAYGWVPWPPVALIIANGTVNTWMRYRYARRAGRTVNYRSWGMEKIVAYAGYLCGFGVARMEVQFYYWACAILMTIVMIHDTKRMLVDPIDEDEAHPAPAEQPRAAPSQVAPGARA